MVCIWPKFELFESFLLKFQFFGNVMKEQFPCWSNAMHPFASTHQIWTKNGKKKTFLSAEFLKYRLNQFCIGNFKWKFHENFCWKKRLELFGDNIRQLWGAYALRAHCDCTASYFVRAKFIGHFPIRFPFNMIRKHLKNAAFCEWFYVQSSTACAPRVCTACAPRPVHPMGYKAKKNPLGRLIFPYISG